MCDLWDNQSNLDIKVSTISRELLTNADKWMTISWINQNTPVDVEDPDEGVLFDVGNQGFVDVLYNPVEELGVDMFGQGVTGVSGLQAWQGLDIRLCSRLQLPVAQPLRHVLVGHAYQLAKRRQVPIVGL